MEGIVDINAIFCRETLPLPLGTGQQVLALTSEGDDMRNCRGAPGVFSQPREPSLDVLEARVLGRNRRSWANQRVNERTVATSHQRPFVIPCMAAEDEVLVMVGRRGEGLDCSPSTDGW